MVDKEEILNKMEKLLNNFDKDATLDVVKDALEMKIDPLETIGRLSSCLKRMGKQIEDGEIPLPYVVIASEILKAASDILMANVPEDKRPKPLGTIVMGTAEGDIHDVGKNLVIMMMRGAGYEVYDLGIDVPTSNFIDKAEEVGADVIGMSALLTTTVLHQRALVKALNDRGLKEKYKVIIGGGPVNQSWCDEVNADLYAPDGITAVAKLKESLRK